MTKTEKAVSFLKLAASGQVQTAFDEYVALDFIHHNQYFKGDRQSLMEAMQEAHRNSPNENFEVKQSHEDKDTVITYSLVTKSDAEIAVVHIIRFDYGKIVEMWDVGQRLIEDSPNENGMF